MFASVDVRWASESITSVTPGLGRRAGVGVGEVAPVGVGVDLEEGAGARRRLDHPVEVHVVGLAPLDLAAGGMPERVDERVLERVHDPVGHLALADPERGVHARHDPVELLEQLVGVVERPVGEHVHLAAREQGEPLQLHRPHALDLAQQLVGRHVVAEAVAGRVVGDRRVARSRARGRPRPSPRSCCGRRRPRCACGGRRGCPRARSAPAARPRGRRPARRGSRAARGRCTACPAARRPPPRSRRRASGRSRRPRCRTRSRAARA